MSVYSWFDFIKTFWKHKQLKLFKVCCWYPSKHFASLQMIFYVKKKKKRENIK